MSAMTLQQVWDWHMNCAVVYEQSGESALADQHRNLAATITAHLTQPAQSVDIEAIREVIESHINEAKKLRHDPESQDYLYEQADKLTAALQEKGK